MLWLSRNIAVPRNKRVVTRANPQNPTPEHPGKSVTFSLLPISLFEPSEKKSNKIAGGVEPHSPQVRGVEMEKRVRKGESCRQKKPWEGKNGCGMFSGTVG